MSFYKYNDRVSLVDIDQNLNLSTKGVLRLLQEAANLASTQCGYGISNSEETNRTWVLLYWRVKIIKKVKFDSPVSVTTWADFTKSIYSNREFELYSNSELVAIADSKWVFVDTKKHSIQKITDDIISNFGQENKKVFDSELNQKIKFDENAMKTYEYKTMKRDLDGNHHVNNITFLDIAVEGLLDSLKDKNFSNVSIIFKKEIMYKDSVSCFYTQKNDEHIVYIYDTTNNILHGAVIFKE